MICESGMEGGGRSCCIQKTDSKQDGLERVRNMKKNFGGRRQMLSAILPVLVSAVVMSGCGSQSSNPADATVVSEESRTNGKVQQELADEDIGNRESSFEKAGESHTDQESAGSMDQETLRASEVTEDSGPLPKAEEGGWVENIMLGTDIHYFSDSLTDGGPRFREMVEYGDGKVVTYIDQITDTFLDEVVKLHPNVLVLSGDLTLNGEKASHKDLAEKLHRVENHGIPVLVIPGNHDINNHQAARYEGEERLPAEYTTPAEFREIYRAFGYDEAASEDPNSLSYLYELDENTWLLMIDSCQYSPVNKVGGAISEATYEWIEQKLEAAWDAGVEIIPIAHHNLLDESEIYVDECTIEHSEQFVDLLEDWNVPVFLSGHLHVQHCKRSDDDRGVWEMVTASLATPSCKYAILTYRDDRSFLYRTRSLDVEAWAKKNQCTEADLLNFKKFQTPFLRRVFYNQAIAALNEVPEITDSGREQMAQLYSLLKFHYYQGTAYQVQDLVRNDPAYALWQEDGMATQQGEYFQYILEDGVRDYNRLEVD